MLTPEQLDARVNIAREEAAGARQDARLLEWAVERSIVFSILVHDVPEIITGDRPTLGSFAIAALGVAVVWLAERESLVKSNEARAIEGYSVPEEYRPDNAVQLETVTPLPDLA